MHERVQILLMQHGHRSTNYLFFAIGVKQFHSIRVHIGLGRFTLDHSIPAGIFSINIIGGIYHTPPSITHLQPVDSGAGDAGINLKPIVGRLTIRHENIRDINWPVCRHFYSHRIGKHTAISIRNGSDRPCIPGGPKTNRITIAV